MRSPGSTASESKPRVTARFGLQSGRHATRPRPQTRQRGANTVFTPSVQLAAGEITVNVRYTRKGDGDSPGLRTLWKWSGANDTGFRAEPIPAWSVAVPRFAMKDAAAGLAAGTGVRCWEN